MEPSVIPLHVAHSLQGSDTGACSQLTALAKIFAAVVFPVPLALKISMHAKISQERARSVKS